MKLADGIAEFIERCDKAFPRGIEDLPLAEQRACYTALCREFAATRPEGMEIRDESLSVSGRDVGLRIYSPVGEGTGPGILYMHGGGFIFGDLDSHDSVTADLALRTGATVVAVDYSLAPEHPYPAPVEDCYEALCHVAGNAAGYGIDPARLAVAGDSAGGKLSAALSLLARDRKGPALRAQLLIYPSIGLGTVAKGAASYEDQPLLSSKEMRYYAQAYLGGEGTTEDPYAAPVLAESFAGLPPAYILAVEVDPLVADARVYAERLESDGVPVELVVAPGLVHGCLRARSISPPVEEAFDAFCRAAKKMLLD